MKPFNYITKLSRSRDKSSSVRTTVPKEVTQFLNLKNGDYLKWTVEIQNDEVTVKVKKA